MADPTHVNYIDSLDTKLQTNVLICLKPFARRHAFVRSVGFRFLPDLERPHSIPLKRFSQILNNDSRLTTLQRNTLCEPYAAVDRPQARPNGRRSKTSSSRVGSLRARHETKYAYARVLRRLGRFCGDDNARRRKFVLSRREKYCP